jgi:hypothetical protein
VIVRIITYERSTLVNSETYTGLDVPQATIRVSVPTGKPQHWIDGTLFPAQIRRYCKAVKATQAATVTGGTTGAALKRITPSSVEQKLRTPV